VVLRRPVRRTFIARACCRFHQVELLDAPPERALVQLRSQHLLVDTLQFAQCESRRHQMHGQRGIPGLGAHAFDGGVQDLEVIEGQGADGVDRAPFDALRDRTIERCERVVRDRHRPAAPIPMPAGESLELL